MGKPQVWIQEAESRWSPGLARCCIPWLSRLEQIKEHLEATTGGSLRVFPEEVSV